MKHTGISLVKAALLRYGRIEAYDAVYRLTDPDGKPHRITRLAAIIHTLRHRDGWNIETIEEPGYLAVYVLSDKPPTASKAVCPVCGVALYSVTPTLAPGFVTGRCLTHGDQMARER